MLQQTQVSTAIPYYQRFMERFPTVESLATAPLERVLELWSGLGYYRRARLMHQAAQKIVARFHGEFPAEYELAQALPGVGDYTARAVLSIAYQKPLYVLDGNVARVIARLIAMKGNVHQTSFRRSVEDHLQQLLSRRRPGDFNQAIMQLGQLVCLPRAPRCEICPLRRSCKAYLLGAPEDFPEPRPRRSAEAHFLAAAVLRHGNKVALIRGLDDGLLDDLWNFPAAFGRTSEAARNLLVEIVKRTFSRTLLPVKPVAQTTHAITHRKIHVEVYVAELAKTHTGNPHSEVARKSKRGARRIDNSHTPIRWISMQDLSRAAISRLTRKIADSITPRTSL
jgi:A/G-specific adenine glycosylase